MFVLPEQTNNASKEAYIDKKELCRLLCLSPRSVERWQRKGWIPVAKADKTCRYRWSEVQAAMATLPFKKKPAALLPQVQTKNKKTETLVKKEQTV